MSLKPAVTKAQPTDYRLQIGPKKGVRKRSQDRFHGHQQTHHNQMILYQFLTIQTWFLSFLSSKTGQ
jgi:hypothetical protein